MAACLAKCGTNNWNNCCQVNATLSETEVAEASRGLRGTRISGDTTTVELPLEEALYKDVGQGPEIEEEEPNEEEVASVVSQLLRHSCSLPRPHFVWHSGYKIRFFLL
ncbi:uncharacterized protein LOC27206932 [Drosophila simulans]|uniref:Uncharacterized protein, isoform D n=1 Tax=Drosophila simulans TaxID=7240 RepID=A0A0J9R481_DROSI|nr:uncharacterized protein LOC27206932 [Drosophila simulans]KMY90898.1 uncharacterized protein Dsimw501_GD27082, isoform D [Drosophila simulans]